MTIIINGAHKLTNVVYIPSNPKGSCARIILENKDGILIESIVLPYSSKNQIESKAFLVVLRIVDDMGAKEIKIYINSQLVTLQVLEEYKAKEERSFEYLALVKEKIAKFS
jgi:ribonuclease HI